MKKLFTYVGVFALSIFSITAQDFQKQDSPIYRSFEGNNKASQALCDTTVNFDGVNDNSIGLVGPGTMNAAIFFDSVEFKFYTTTPTIEAIQFDAVDMALITSITLNIYEGSTVSDYTTATTNNLTLGTLIYSKDVTADAVTAAGNFGIHTLDSSLTINTSLGYVVELQVAQASGAQAIGIDAGPQIGAKGGWISTGGAYSQLFNVNNFDANWNIRVCTNGDIFIPDYDVKVADALFTPTRYEVLPFSQVDPNGYNFAVAVENIGLATVNNAAPRIRVNSGIFVDSTIITSIAPGATQVGTMTGLFTISAPGDYQVEAFVRIDSNDFNLVDNTLNGSFNVSDSLLYSRSLQSDFYTGVSRFNGNVYDIFNETWARSVRARYFNPGPPNAAPILSDGDELIAEIWEVNPDGTIGSLEYTSEPLILSGMTPSTRYEFEFTFDSTNVLLFEGRHLVAVSNPGCLLTNTASGYYDGGTAFGNSNPNNPNWQETPGQYFNVDLILSETQVYFGIESGLNNTISIYPNPAKDIVRIEGTEANGSIQILDITGKVIANVASTSKASVIDLSNFDKGVYVVKYVNNTSIMTEKLIVE